MDDGSSLPEVPEHPPPPPPRLYERLRQIAGYSWDESIPPFHSSYDFWHIFGTRVVYSSLSQATSPYNASSHSDSAPSRAHSYESSSTPQPQPLPTIVTPTAETSYFEQPVVARISYHDVREERAFQLGNKIATTADPNGDHITRPIDLKRLSRIPGDRGNPIIAIYEHPGHNFLADVLDFGPAYYKARKQDDGYVSYCERDFKLQDPISLHYFLDFAIGAAECLEILHHGEILHHNRGIVHGEIRGDAFHFNIDENRVRIVSFGSGLRSFEHGLTSTGWSTLSKELGAKNKLLYISPEQTGRRPAEPDSRTDIYSLGVLLWSLLTQQPVYTGDSALDIVQGVLGRRIPNVSTVRMDIPEVIGRIIQKCTAKNVADRYQSASGLRHDLLQVQKLLGDGDSSALKNVVIGTRDVSSFFMLPTAMIGRREERNELIKVIDRVAKSHSKTRSGGTGRFSEVSSFSNEFATLDDASSDGGASSIEATTRRSGSFTQGPPSDTRPSKTSAHHSVLSDTLTASNDTMSSSQSGTGTGTGSAPLRMARAWERNQSVSLDALSLVDSFSAETRISTTDSSSFTLSRHLGSAKFRRKGLCEVVTVEGAGGLGKSFLVHSVMAEARRRGYYATAKFDSARRTAYGPLIKLLRTLFQQISGERNIETPFYQVLKQYIRPVWPMLHNVLDLPKHLLGEPDVGVPRSISSQPPNSYRGNAALGSKRRGSSPGSSPGLTARNPAPVSQTSGEYLRSGSSTKTTRLMNTFMDVLRVFTTHKFICFCLDDLHFADDESFDLISQIISAKMKMLVIITYRPDELSPAKMQNIIHPPEADEMSRSTRPLLTRIRLAPLTEADILQYVASTLCRPQNDILSLALVIQSKTAGNPFYMREMLSACHHKRCIWYDYKDGLWRFDLDRLFEQFEGEKEYDVLDTGFITQRLSELPPSARTVLAWAALLGNSFSFELICRLMSGEFQYEDTGSEKNCATILQHKYTEGEAIAGLQAVIQAYIVVPSETDDRFRFAHDRYVHASAALKECQSKKMHFIIAQTLIKYYSVEARQRDSTASHVCEAVDIIKERVVIRKEFRRLLIDCAQTAIENGARPTAAKYYGTALKLLQEKPWAEEADDVSYEETMQLYLHSAECYLFMGQLSAANDVLSIVFANAKTPLDKAPAYVLQSRIFAQNGNSLAALISLKECLGALGVALDDEPTYERCDERFMKISTQLQKQGNVATADNKQSSDPLVSSIGAVLSETTTAAWWSDNLQFYHLTLSMLEMHLSRGSFPQSGMAFLYLGIVALSRFNMNQFAVDMGRMSQELLYDARDAFSMARGQMLHSSFLAHLHCSMTLAISQTEDAVELATVAGDRMSTIMSFGLAAQTKFFASENCVDLEVFCQYCCEDFSNWCFDTRGGALLIAIRQVSRALQGKTQVNDPRQIMTDSQHDGPGYKSWLMTQTHDSNRSTLFYESLEIVVLFLFGHYEYAIGIGRRCYENLHMLWTARNSRLILLFYGLARAGQLLRQRQDPRPQAEDIVADTAEVVEELRTFARMTMDWTVVSNVNYLAWARLLEAQMAELAGNHGDAIKHYEEALDHTAEHGFHFEEALGNYLMAGFFVRHMARRSARAALQDAIGIYRQMGAIGVAGAIEEEHSLLLHGPTRNHRTAEIGVQTDFVADTSSVPYRVVDGEELTQVPSNTMSDVKGDRIGAWRGSMDVEDEDGVPSLDMIDLHAILKFSQVISSRLQVEQLLETMCDVILQMCGGSATLAAIVVQETGVEEMCIAASADPENGTSAHKPGLSLSDTSLVAENVVIYCSRLLETLFIPDLIADERFGNVDDLWLQRNPASKAVIAIPITQGANTQGSDPLLGVLYLEGEPGSFTGRNVTVLKLLVTQISISYSNALSIRNVEKISAENRSMVSVQKRALGKALDAETKAKNAESEAKRNVRLAEEAAKAKSIFLANVSHELRTPLNGVIGNSELLRDSNLNREQLEMADSIRVSADLLLTVINDILDFSKMEADKMKLYIIAFNPEEMVREVVRAVSYSNREKTSKKNVKIVQDIKLPSMLVFGDPIRLHQVLGNLIGNSLKFTEDGSITIGARLDADTEEKATLTFWVRDTGIGIPAQQLAKLFQPFSQADASTARKYGGSGLGLSICKSLIEIMMEGKIQLESEEKVGTTAWFTVSFEKAKPDVSAGDAQPKSKPPIDRYSEMPSASERMATPNPYLDLTQVPKWDIRICIAEDNPINQKIAIQYVQRLGYNNVIAYDNGMKAVEGLRQKAKEGTPYHIVLMDVQMPVLDGYDATRLIRKDSDEAVRKMLVIAMTASAIQGDREKCLAAGMNDYLAKPVRSEVLRQKLDAYLNQENDRGPEVTQSLPSSISSQNKLNGQSSNKATTTSPSLSSSIKESESTPSPPPRRKSSTRILDPMQEGAVFNMPLVGGSMQAMDSPIYADVELQGPSPVSARTSPTPNAATASIGEALDDAANDMCKVGEDGEQGVAGSEASTSQATETQSSSQNIDGHSGPTANSNYNNSETSTK